MTGKPCSSGKRQFGSPSAARLGNITNPKRIRIYRCDECNCFHTTTKKKERFK